MAALQEVKGVAATAPASRNKRCPITVLLAAHALRALAAGKGDAGPGGSECLARLEETARHRMFPSPPAGSVIGTHLDLLRLVLWAAVVEYVE
jgi:hypothetical protein